MKRDSEFRYTKLAGTLREQILSGFIRPGQFLLSENDLCTYYGLSRSSVRKALKRLLDDGLIVKKPGQGTIVSPDLPTPDGSSRQLRILATSPSNFIDYCMPIILDAFRRQNPEVEVKLTQVPGPAIVESFVSGQEMGFTPDILFISDPQYLRLLDSARFVDLLPVLSPAIADLYPELRRAFGGSASLLAAPVSFSPVFLVINPELFRHCGAKVPTASWSMDEFVAAARQMTRDFNGDGINDLCGFSLPLSFSRWPAIALRYGMRFHSGDSRESVARTMSFIEDILHRHRVATLSLQSREAFLHGRAGMTLTTSFELAGWLRADLPFKPEIAPFPVGDESSSLLIANVMAIPEREGDSEMAVRFVKTALSPEVQQRISRETGFLSVLQSVNRHTIEPSYLKSLGLGPGRTDNSYFLHELLSDSSASSRLNLQMELFWAGLESAVDFTDRYFRLISGS